MPTRNAELERTIRSAPDNAAAYLVYADWLQTQGDPLGELIVLQHADRDSERVAALTAQLAPPDAVQVDWRWGMWRRLRLANHDGDWMDEKFDALAIARDAFARTTCCALRELHVGVLRWDFDHVDIPAVLVEAAKHPWAATLAVLHLGDLHDVDVDMAHYVIGDVGAAITAAFPALEKLVLHSGDQGWRGEGETFGIGGLTLPRLRELVIETCALSKQRLAHVLGAELPALERLELWFGSEDQGADVELEDLHGLLAGDVHPRVRDLGLRNAELANEIAAALPGSPIAARLERLDLSMGTLTDAGARVLAAGATQLGALTGLVVDDNFLEKDGIDALRAAFGSRVSTNVQKEVDDSIPGEQHYFVSVGE
jgi:uncharacterized protein (TIGR02996 family)